MEKSRGFTKQLTRKRGTAAHVLKIGSTISHAQSALKFLHKLYFVNT